MAALPKIKGLDSRGGFNWGKKIDDMAPEKPPGSNRCFIWTIYNSYFHTRLNGLPYCGAGTIVRHRHSGLKVPSDWISVLRVEGWGRDHHLWRSSPVGLKRDDTVVIGGRGKHVGVAVRNRNRLLKRTLMDETNTSPDEVGDQYNGGACVRKYRKDNEIYGYVRTSTLVTPVPKKVKVKPAKRKPVPSHAPVIHRVLKQGMHGYDVAVLRYHLGLSNGTVFDKHVGDAIVKFRKRHKIGKSRKAGPVLYNHLGIKYVPRKKVKK